MATIWFLIVGVLFLGVAFAGSYVRRLPLSMAILYLAVGYGLGPEGFGLIVIDPIGQATLVERITEIAVIVSLFTAGLKLRISLDDRRWRPALRLAFGSMTLTVAAIAAAGAYGMGLTWGAAVLLGAILAPTDPVLASDVQVEHPFDYDPLRFSLTGEAGFNDGTAFPFVMLGLGLLGLHDIGGYGLKWIGIDVFWAVGAALMIGLLLGSGVSRFVLYLRREHREAVGLDDFLAMGLIGVSYGTALLCHSYGFLAVFAAGLALRRMERMETPHGDGERARAEAVGQKTDDMATDPVKAPAVIAESVLHFNEQLERIGELVVVVLIGAMLSSTSIPAHAAWFLPLLFLAVRPLAVTAGLVGSNVPVQQRRLISFFGIRGIGSLYYLMYAVTHGLSDSDAKPLIGLTLAAITVSTLVHGVSVTPLMKMYSRMSARGPSI